MNGGVKVANEILGGTSIVETEVTTAAPAIVVVRPKAFPAEPGGDDSPEVVEVSMPEVGHAGSAVIVERHSETAEGPQLTEANIIVSGGRGLGAADKFSMMEELVVDDGLALDDR